MKIVKSCLLCSVLYIITFASAWAGEENEGALSAEKRRNIVKVFSVKSDEMLLISNQFGEVKVNLWSKNEIKVEIDITTRATTESRAKEFMDGIDIDEKRENNRIVLTTNIRRENLGGFKSLTTKGVESSLIKINYTVYMPKENPLAVNNRFGDIDIPTFMAPLVVNSKNGTFKATSLSGNDNRIDVRFGNAMIGKINEGKLESHYSNVTMEHVSKLVSNNKFGELNIGDINDLKADIDYAGVKIKVLRGNGDVNLNFSEKFSIEELKNSAKNVNIKAAYSQIALPAESNSFNVSVTYGNFTYPVANTNFTQQPSKEERPFKVKQYQGKIGPGNGAKVTVISTYGDVKFKN